MTGLGRLRWSLWPAGVALLCALGPALAHAAASGSVEYDLTVKVSGSFERQETNTSDGEVVSTKRQTADFSWRTTYKRVRLPGRGQAVGKAHGGSSGGTHESSGSWHTNENKVAVCNGSLAKFAPEVHPGIPELLGSTGPIGFVLPIEERLFSEGDCTFTDEGGTYKGKRHGGPSRADSDELTVFFTLPRDAIGNGKIIQNVEGRAGDLPPPNCASAEEAADGITCQQSMKWSGTVTFLKKGARETQTGPIFRISRDLLSEILKQSEVSPDRELEVSVSSQDAKIAAFHRAVLSISSPPAGSRGLAAGPPAPVGSARFRRSADGKRAVARVKLSRAFFDELKRRGSQRVIGTVAYRSGKGKRTVSAPFTLRAP